MKTLLLFCLLIITSAAQAQNKGDNTILVKGVTFDQVVNTLLDQGFKIDKIDKDFKTVRTEFKEPNPKYSYKVSYDIRVKDDVAIITGETITSNMKFEIKNGKSGLDKLAFESMSNFAKSLNGGMSYAKK